MRTTVHSMIKKTNSIENNPSDLKVGGGGAIACTNYNHKSFVWHSNPQSLCNDWTKNLSCSEFSVDLRIKSHNLG